MGIKDPGIDDADEDLDEILNKCQVGGDDGESFIINVEKFEKLFTAYCKRVGIIGGTFKKKLPVKSNDLLNDIRDYVEDNFSIIKSFEGEGFEILPYAKSFILRNQFGEVFRIGTAQYPQFSFSINLVLRNGNIYMNYSGQELNLDVYRQGMINFKREPKFRDWSKGREEYSNVLEKELKLKTSQEDSIETISIEVSLILKKILPIFKKFKARNPGKSTLFFRK